MMITISHGIKSNFLSRGFSEDGIGYVHSIFKTSFNVLFKGRLLHFSEAGENISAFGIGIPPAYWKKLLESIRIDDRVKNRQGSWMIYSRATIWKFHLEELKEIDCQLPKIDEITPDLIYNLKNDFQSLIIEEKTELVTSEGNRLYLEKFMDAGWDDEEFYQQFVAHFLGRGIGLTPSGDDLIMGIMMMSVFFDGPLNWSRIISSQLERTQTTDVSKAYYQALLSGYASTPFVYLLQAIKDKKMSDWNQAIARISDYGHTSGWDTLYGIFLFLQKLEKNDGRAGVGFNNC